jgi:hypothetical protein
MSDLTQFRAWGMMPGMCRHRMVLLSLIAVLSGTPLRQAAAADDYARAVGAYVNGYVLDTVDGDVGDDQDLSILKADGDTHSLTATNLLAMSDVRFTPYIPFLSPPNIGDRRWADLPVSLPASSGRRSTWLQYFLF